MKKSHTFRRLWLQQSRRSLAPVLAFAIVACGAKSDSKKEPGLVPTKEEGAISRVITILETTDIHSNILNFDYYKNEVVENYGLVKIATLVNQQRKINPQAILVDNGDLLQGNLFGDYQSKKYKEGNLKSGPKIYELMGKMGYEVANLGNHDFNFGLQFLQNAIALKPSKLAIINSNVFAVGNTKKVNKSGNVFQPYTIVSRKFDNLEFKIGFFGVVPTQIMEWDKNNLAEKVIAKDMVETSQAVAKELRAKGVDLVVAVAHSGINPIDCAENATLCIAKIPEVDAVLSGHSHQEFPGTKYANYGPLVNELTGTLAGKPALMPGSWGSHLGVMKFEVKPNFTKLKPNGAPRWQILRSSSQLLSTKEVAPDAALTKAFAGDHQKAVEFASTPIANIDERMSTYFSRAIDTKALKLIATAQAWQVNKLAEEYPTSKLAEHLKTNVLLSAAAPFKTGFQGIKDYSLISQGAFPLRSVADLYVYPNTLAVVKLSVAELKTWLENSALNFNQIEENAKGENPLLSGTFKGYNFDAIYGNNFSYDVNISSKPGERIQNILLNGKSIPEGDSILLATNNYRTTGLNGFPAGRAIEMPNILENREAIVNYLRAQPGTVSISAKPSWRVTSSKVLVEKIKAKELTLFLEAPLDSAVEATATEQFQQLSKDESSGLIRYSFTPH